MKIEVLHLVELIEDADTLNELELIEDCINYIFEDDTYTDFEKSIIKSNIKKYKKIQSS